MDYEKLYKEALEAARQGKSIEQIFPELKESEDEKIRKGLLSHLGELHDYKGTNAPIKTPEHYSAWIAWLEKQGEQKGAITAQEAWKDMRFEVYAQASGNRHEANVSDDSTKMFSLNDIDEIFEKIGDTAVEQNPAWSEEDEEMFFSLEKLLNEASCYSCTEGSDKILNWLKSLKQLTIKNLKE